MMRLVWLALIIAGLLFIVKAQTIKRVCITEGENESEDDAEGEEEEEGMAGHGGSSMSGHRNEAGSMNNRFPSHRMDSLGPFRNFMDNARDAMRSGLRRRRPDDPSEQGMFGGRLRPDDPPSLEIGTTGLQPDDRLTLEMADSGLGLTVDDGFDMRMSPNVFSRGMSPQSMFRKKRSFGFNAMSMASRSSDRGVWHGHQGEEEEMEYEEEENENEGQGGWAMFGDSEGQQRQSMTGQLSCASIGKRIQVIRIIYGESTRGGCITQDPQCEEEGDYDEEISPMCDGQTRCSFHLTPRQLRTCNKVNNFVGIEYRCVDEWTMFDICQERSQVVYEPSVYVASPSYAQVQRRPAMSSMCECILRPLNHTSLFLEALQTHLMGTKPNCTEEHVLIEAKLKADTEPMTNIKVCGNERLTRKSLKGSTRMTFLSQQIETSDGFIGKFSVPTSPRLSAMMVECGPVFMPGMTPPTKMQKFGPSISPSGPGNFPGVNIDFIGKTSVPSLPGGMWDLGQTSNMNPRLDGSMFLNPRSPQTKPRDTGLIDQVKRKPIIKNNLPRLTSLTNPRNRTTPKISQPFLNQVNQLPVDSAVRHSLMNAIMDSALPDLDSENFMPTLLASGMTNQGVMPPPTLPNPRQIPRPPSMQNPRQKTIATPPTRPTFSNSLPILKPNPRPDPRQKTVVTPPTKATFSNSLPVLKPNPRPDPRQKTVVTPPTKATFSNSLPVVEPTNSTALKSQPVSKAIVDSSGIQPIIGITPGLTRNLIAQSKGPAIQEDKTTGHTVGYVMGAVGLLVITMGTVIIYVMWKRREQKRTQKNVEAGCVNIGIEVPLSVSSIDDDPIYNTLSDTFSDDDNLSQIHMTIAEAVNHTRSHCMEKRGSEPSTVDQKIEPLPSNTDTDCQSEAFVYSGPSVPEIGCSRPNAQGQDPIYDNNTG